MSSTTTNYYLSGVSEHFKLTDAPAPTRGRPKILGEKEGGQLEVIMPVGFADAQKGNMSYHKLLENLHISSMENNEILSALHSGCTESDVKASIDNKMMVDYLVKERIPESTKIDIIRLRLHQRWSIPSLWAKFSVSPDTISEIFKWF